MYTMFVISKYHKLNNLNQQNKPICKSKINYSVQKHQETTFNKQDLRKPALEGGYPRSHLPLIFLVVKS